MGRGGDGIYLIALGSNRRHPLHGPPRTVIAAALSALEREGFAMIGASRVIQSAPLGPSHRRFANAAALVGSALRPPEMLALLKRIEAGFGRRAGGQRWRERVLDLDIVLWSGGTWASARLLVPHPAFRERGFVLGPAARIAPDWRDPVSGLTLAQLKARLTRPRPLPR